MELRRERTESLGRRLPTPRALLGLARQRADDVGGRLPRALIVRADRSRALLAAVTGRLRPQLLERQLKDARSQLDRLWRVAASLNPEAVLGRGYALVRDAQGHVVATAAAATAARQVNVKFADSSVDATIGLNEPAPRAQPAKKPAAQAQNQPKLL